MTDTVWRSLKTPFLPLATLSPGCVLRWLQVWRREHGGGRGPGLIQRCLGSYVCWNQFDVGSEARGHGATTGRWAIRIKGGHLLSCCLPPGLRYREICPATTSCVTGWERQEFRVLRSQTGLRRTAKICSKRLERESIQYFMLYCCPS